MILKSGISTCKIPIYRYQICCGQNQNRENRKIWKRVRQRKPEKLGESRDLRKMTEYGNILIIYSGVDEPTMTKVETAIAPFLLKSERIENSIFIQTSSPGSSRQLADAVRALGLTFILYYNFLPESSFVKRGNVPDPTFTAIEHIMLD